MAQIRARAAASRSRSTTTTTGAVAETVLEGLGVSPGVAIGLAHLHEVGDIQVPVYALKPDEIEGELARFRGAVDKSLRQLAKLKAKGADLPAAVAEEIGFLLDAHAQMLSGSRLVRGVEARISSGPLNAEAAVQQETSTIAKTFAAMEDAYLAARVQDIREVGRRLLRNLTRSPFQAFSHLAEGTILVAEEITPADTALMNPALIAAFGCVLGGMEGHTAIMARSLGLPAVLGAAGLIGAVRSGETIIIDGSAGHIVVRPTPTTLEAYERKRLAFVREEKQLQRLARLPAVTRDGIDIGLYANLELPRDVETARMHGAAGIGLLRSEFMFMNRDDVPGEDEQYEQLAHVVKALGGRPATIRT